jgi:alpha-tubulin suppressor-like RCC1 family protein
VIQSGEVWCWGDNGANYALGFYEEGAGIGKAYHEAVRVPSLSGVRAIAAGGNFGCAITEGGEVRCWGSDRYRIGAARSEKSLPWESSPIAGLGPASAISLNSETLCALVRGGQVACAGRNDVGQLGDGTRVEKEGLRGVVGVSDAVALAPAGYVRCAVLQGGRLACWGLSVHGSAGDGNDEQRAVATPAIAGVSGVIEVATGWSHTCALLVDHTVLCWGGNNYGQLGDGTTEPRVTPQRVPGLERIKHIHARYATTCAVREDGTAWCWGLNSWGQAGVPPRAPEPARLQVPQ